MGPREELERRLDEAFALLKQADAVEPSALSLEDERTTAKEETTEGDEDRAQTEKREPPKLTFINLFQHPDAHPYVLDMALLKKYGPEWMEWEPETLELRVTQDFNTASLSDLNRSKLNAMITLHYTDTFWLDWDVFLPCTMSLNGFFPDFEVMQIPTVSQCAVAVDIARRVREDVPWSDELRAYLDVVHRFEGIFCAIDPLDFVEIDGEDYPVDCKEVSMLWPAVRKSGKPPTAETVEAEQLRRLLIVHESLLEDRARLKSQLPILLDA